jgi:hypothetical protein
VKRRQSMVDGRIFLQEAVLHDAAVRAANGHQT